MLVGDYISEKGEFRKKNQDRATLIIPKEFKDEFALGVVCDGIGSFANSEKSAEMMVDGLNRWAEGIIQLYSTVYSEDDVVEDLENTIVELNELIWEYRSETGDDIGCTLSLLLGLEDHYHIFHVGDSRIYRLNEELEQLTADEVSYKEKEGTVRKLLGNYVGKSKELWMKHYTGVLEDRDIFLICSDGVYKRLAESDIDATEVFRANGKNIGNICNDLINKVYDRGETDNSSCVIIGYCCK